MRKHYNVYALSQIREADLERLPSAVKDEWIRQAYNWQGTPADFAKWFYQINK